MEEYECNYTVKWAILHELFNGTTLDNDIALLQLNTNVEYNNDIQPICLTPTEWHGQSG